MSLASDRKDPLPHFQSGPQSRSRQHSGDTPPAPAERTPHGSNSPPTIWEMTAGLHRPATINAPTTLLTRSGATGTPQNQSLLERTGHHRQPIHQANNRHPLAELAAPVFLLSYEENRPDRATELEGSWKQKLASGHTHRNSWNDFFSHWLHPGPNRRLNHTQHAFSDQEQSLKKIRRIVRRRH